MAINIGTNFSYKGQQFLDQRQKVATKQDLLSWSIAVPEGFEVYCEEDNKWYIYDSRNSSPLTGHYKIRLEKELENSEIQATVDSNTENIANLDKVVFPLHFENVVGAGDYEYKASGVLPFILWDLDKNGEKLIADRILVDGVESPRKDKYIPSSPITETTTYRIEAYYGSEYCYMDAQIRLRMYGYVFVNETIEVTRDWLLSQQPTENIFIKEFTPEDNEDKTYSLNCSGNEVSGGKYVHLIFPIDFARKIVSGNIEMYVGGMLFSDIQTTGGSIFIEGKLYGDLIFSYPQNSENLNITLKHQ
jgi:hypothetical protein